MIDIVGTKQDVKEFLEKYNIVGAVDCSEVTYDREKMIYFMNSENNVLFVSLNGLTPTHRETTLCLRQFGKSDNVMLYCKDDFEDMKELFEEYGVKDNNYKIIISEGRAYLENLIPKMRKIVEDMEKWEDEMYIKILSSCEYSDNPIYEYRNNNKIDINKFPKVKYNIKHQKGIKKYGKKKK